MVLERLSPYWGCMDGSSLINCVSEVRVLEPLAASSKEDRWLTKGSE